MTAAFETIANGLAEHGYSITDQFLNQAEVDAILSSGSFQAASENFRKAGVGKQDSQRINEGIRGDYIQWLDKTSSSPAVTTYLNRVEALMQFMNHTLFLSLKDYEIHMTVYPVGSYYKRHLDQFRTDDHRKLSIICYLNEGWKEADGGHLRIYLPDRALDVLPISGRLVCFRSDQLEHEVLPATRDRLSLTGWILDQFADLKHL